METNKIILQGQIIQTDEVKEGYGKHGSFVVQNVVLQFQNGQWLNKVRVSLFDNMAGCVKNGDQIEVHVACDLKPSKNAPGAVFNVLVGYRVKNLTTGKYLIKTANNQH